MPTTNQVRILIIVAVIAYALGRYVSPAAPKVETASVKSIDTEITKTITKAPNGKIRSVTVTKISDNESQIKKIAPTTSKPIKPMVSLLGGYDLTSHKNVYGLSITKPLIGPVQVGVWGLSNGSLGISIGAEF